MLACATVLALLSHATANLHVSESFGPNTNTPVRSRVGRDSHSNTTALAPATPAGGATTTAINVVRSRFRAIVPARCLSDFRFKTPPPSLSHPIPSSQSHPCTRMHILMRMRFVLNLVPLRLLSLVYLGVSNGGSRNKSSPPCLLVTVLPVTVLQVTVLPVAVLLDGSACVVGTPSVVTRTRTSFPCNKPFDVTCACRGSQGKPPLNCFHSLQSLSTPSTLLGSKHPAYVAACRRSTEYASMPFPHMPSTPSMHPCHCHVSPQRRVCIHAIATYALNTEYASIATYARAAAWPVVISRV